MRKLSYLSRISICIILSIALLCGYLLFFPKKSLITLFPIEHYDQTLSDWIKPSDPDYDKPLLTPAQQAQRKAELYQHYFGTKSPWNSEYITHLFTQNQGNDLKEYEQKQIDFYTNDHQPTTKIGYGENFRPYSHTWIMQIAQAIHLAQFSNQQYDLHKRAIAVDNLQGRNLPTDEVYFYRHTIAGEGYPFDNLQASVIWAGTPLYILGETLDHAWSLVLAPSFIAWVKNSGIATVDELFITEWLQIANQHLAAIATTAIPIIDSEDNIFRFSGYIGTVLPGVQTPSGIKLLIPVANKHHQAELHHTYLTQESAVFIPLLPTMHHFVDIMKHLIGRPYGWGSMYFYNDCSSELKNLFTPFGIWIPMHSSDQVDPNQLYGTSVDLSQLKPNIQARLRYLRHHGHKFMTIAYIGGHVFLYLGEYINPTSPHADHVLLSYQNIWGLKPPHNNYRAVIGQSVLFPLLKKYPEDKNLVSPLGNPTLQLMYLDSTENNIR